MPTDQPRWYQEAVIYQTHVRAFNDANGDGIGDFRGLTERLDYLQELGVTAVWLLPFYPSPLRDDGYDIADYRSINSSYGTMRDFTRFLDAAHERGLKVVTELVVNHTSDQHEWFQRARRAEPGSPERDFYVWSDTPDRYTDARIIFTDTEPSNWTWDPVAGAYYWHRFFSHQPDLNFENPAVRQAVVDSLDFWLDKGVDGFRLDAVPYLYEEEGTMCENLPRTHEFLKDLRAHVDANYDDRMLLAEANQWPEDAVEYFGDGDECHMCFHFPLMPRLFMSLRMENRFPIIDILEQTPEIPDTASWAIFLRNHDELTLEMVTDEERDYMYRVYAEDPQARINVGIRRRLAPLLHNDRRQIELLNALLLALPGTPVLYYGDEIGMGDNIYLGDRNGVRTPMQWSPDRNAGFSLANPQRLYFPVVTDPEYHYETINVEAQRANSSSLWWWTKRMIAQRRSMPALTRGDLSFLTPDNPKVLAFERTSDDETVLVVANLSKHTQPVELDLSHHEGVRPIEVFGQTPFPAIGEFPYFLTPGPYQIYWFRLEREAEPIDADYTRPRIRLRTELGDDAVFRARTQLARALITDLPRRRWFRSKALTISELDVVDVVALPAGPARLLIVDVQYLEGGSERYLLPLALLEGEEAAHVDEHRPETIVADVSGTDGGTGVVVDATHHHTVGTGLLGLTRSRRRLNGTKTALYGTGSIPKGNGDRDVRIIATEQSNTSMVFDDEFILKVFRKLEPGLNPDIEISRFLTGRFEHTPAVRGVLSAEIGNDTVSVGVVQDYVANQGDAWSYTVDLVGEFIDEVAALPDDGRRPGRARHPLDLVGSEPPDVIADLVALSRAPAELLGTRTGELHRALASAPQDPTFAPEPISPLYQRSLYQAMRSSVRENFALLRRRRRTLPDDVAEAADDLLATEDDILERLRRLADEKTDAPRLRIHGDYHLGQVLFTGNDFVIIDFEGEPLRPLSERRIKRSPLRDVAGMIRSYHYASRAGLDERIEEGVVGREPEAVAAVEPWLDAWFRWVSASFLEGYLDAVADAGLVPSDGDQLQVFLDAFLIDKAVYELGYELNNRPDWVAIALEGIRLHAS